MTLQPTAPSRRSSGRNLLSNQTLASHALANTGVLFRHGELSCAVTVLRPLSRNHGMKDLSFDKMSRSNFLDGEAAMTSE